jgi:hypothetical protein
LLFFQFQADWRRRSQSVLIFVQGDIPAQDSSSLGVLNGIVLHNLAILTVHKHAFDEFDVIDDQLLLFSATEIES